MIQFLRTNISKIIGPYLLMMCVWLTVRAGLPLPAGFAATLTDLSTDLLLATILALKGLTERWVALKTNPENVAKKLV